MSVSMTAPRYVTRPSVTPVTSTLLDHVDAKTVDHFGLMNNNGLWPSYNCMDTLIPTPMCPDPLIEEGGEPKVFVNGAWVPAYDFAVYGGVQCYNVGLDEADMRAEVKRVFEANMSKGVEQSLLWNRFVATDSDAPVAWDGPRDLTPGTDIGLVVALGMLEGDAAREYAGLPTIHMPRAAATVLESNGLIVWEGNKAFTKNGSKVVMGGGYDDEDMLASGEWDMYATGEVYVEMSEQIDVHAYVIPGDGNGVGSDETGLADNTQIALAERMFRVAIDCYLTKITGKAF